jgi:hypothetical protein
VNNRIFVLILAVTIGIGIGAFAMVWKDAGSAPGDRSASSVAENLVERLKRSETRELNSEQVDQIVESLIQILDEEIAERRILAEQLDGLQSDMTDLRQNLRARVEEAFAAGASGRVSSNEGRNTSQERRSQADQAISERMAAAGFSPQQIESLRQRQGALQMRQIEIDDRARREGWVNTPQYYEEVNNLMNGSDVIRQDLGDDAYDRYLYASGRPNRISVSSVIETSPARQAGFQPGDVILSYGGERVFSSQQLVNLRSAGASGMPVAVDVVRNGEPIQITMPRGPMGIQTQSDLVDPGAAGGG